MAEAERGYAMNVLEKIFEELEERGNIQFSSYSKPLIAVEDVLKIIRSHMDDEDNDGWIPVEERLPEEGEKCIITDKYGYMRDGIIYDYADSKDDKPSFHRWDDEYWQCFRPDVIAWQPLPKPYRSKEKDNE